MKQVKCTISESANDALEKMISSTNEEFRNGRVTRQSLLSWIILHFSEKSFRRLIPSIRQSHVDPILVVRAYLADLESAKKAGRPAPNLHSVQAMIRNQSEI